MDYGALIWNAQTVKPNDKMAASLYILLSLQLQTKEEKC